MLVDASESLDPGKFYSQFLDFVQTAWCGFDVADDNRGAMITFGKEIVTRIPLQRYSREEWFEQVELVRADPETCCKCCTPTAEAFRAARLLLTANPPATEDTTRLVMLISDGDPWQNPKGTSTWAFPRIGPAAYTFKIVPTQARLLRDLNGQKDAVRLLFLGVPNRLGQPPEIDYFSGKKVLGKKRCIKRARRTQCFKIPHTSKAFPLTSSPAEKYISVSTSWEVQDLIDLVNDDLCRPISPAPTLTPTKVPTPPPTRPPTSRAPSRSPTTSPTEAKHFDGIDLYLFLDRSKSMQWRAPYCRGAPGSNPSASDVSVCWELFLGFAGTLANKSSNLLPVLPTKRITRIGWQDDYVDKSKGLRVWIYGFACANSQSTPIVEKIGEKISSLASLNAALAAARNIIPDGGTCPGATFERSLGMIMANDLTTRPYKAALLFTDGVFYDQPKPEAAANGFAHFGVLTYALGIAIPSAGDAKGLTPAEVRDQKKQLLAFVNGENDRFKNFGAEGYHTLTEIAQSFVERLPIDSENALPRISNKPYWCGFSSGERCINSNPETFDTSRYCKWIPNNPSNFFGSGRCMDKDWCGWPKATCEADRFCDWFSKKCNFRGWDTA
jgi:hypothetical protein